MATICPTVMGENAADYRSAINRVGGFASRLHIDFSDGNFSKPQLIPVGDAYWPDGIEIDFHIMYQRPMGVLEQVIIRQPHLVIVHAEAEGVGQFVNDIQGFGIKVGVALLPGTSVDVIKPYSKLLDHVLIFSGKLGSYGGVVNFEHLAKVTRIRQLCPTIEIGWDGGIKYNNIERLIVGGIDVLNVGGFIQKADFPEKAYDILVEEVLKIEK